MSKPLARVLIIGFTWPEPDATAAGIRILQIIEFFKSQNFDITFSSAASHTEFTASLEKFGAKSVPISINHESFDLFIKDLQPDIVLFDRFLTEEYFGWRVAQCLPDTIRILDTLDLHSLRKSRENALKKGIKFEVCHWLTDDHTKRELASIYRSDLSLIISSFEVDWLSEHTPLNNSQLCYFPFLIENNVPFGGVVMPEFEERKGFIFIGNGRHAPNVDAIYYLHKDIWPGIRDRLPEAFIHIYGAYLPKAVLSLHDPENGFFVQGWAEDVGKVMKKSLINLAPLRFGAGLKGKLFSGFAAGTPSILTEAAAEGTGLDRLGELVGSDSRDFIKKAIALYEDKKLWEQMSERGREMLQHQFNKADAEGRLIKAMKNLYSGLDQHRAENIIGSMLLHHTMTSSKYLSKWISLKQGITKEN